jgi:Fe-S-cluster containining protein
MPGKKITRKTCLQCGACCTALHGQKAFCDVTPADEKRMGEKLRRRLVLYPSLLGGWEPGKSGVAPQALHILAAVVNGKPYAAIKTKDVTQRSGPLKGIAVHVCAALTGSLMHQVKCTIYRVRPDVCHWAVKPGDRTCIKVRELFEKAAKENR